jgi:PAS domain S-box-containing protein
MTSLCHAGRMTRSPTDADYRLLVQNVLDYAIFMLDPTGRIISWNAGARRIKGYRETEILGRNFAVFYPAEDVADGKPARELETAVADGRLEDEGWRIRRDGTRFWANVVITALVDAEGQLRGFAKVTRDMTERRAAEQALSDRRRLLAHMVEAQEVERRRIAWDVHDDSIQSMVSVGMRLQLLAGQLPAEHAAAVTQIDEAVRGSIGRLRELIFRLQPPEIDEEGLARVLGEHLAQLGLAHTLRYELAAEPPQETAITVFRICQEALTNVRKHARASTVDVSVVPADGGIRVRVTDDGVGVGPLERLPRGDHFGVIEMRERAEIADGWLSVGPGPAGGTTVEFWLPVVAP